VHVQRDPERLRCVAYRGAAEWLNRACSLSDRVAAPEIGALGFYFKGKILDACGLVSPEAIPFLPVPASQSLSSDVGTISLDLVKAERPEWVATLPFFAERSLLPSRWFHAHYRHAARVPLPEPWQNDAILVFRRPAGARPSGTEPSR